MNPIVRVSMIAFCAYFVISCGSSPAPVVRTNKPIEPMPLPQNLPKHVQKKVEPKPTTTTPSIEQISVAKPLNETTDPDSPSSGDDKGDAQQLSPREHLTKAVALLRAGQENTARVHLKSILGMNPGDPVAQSLLMQIDEPAHAYFGKKYFRYKTKPGDTLSGLALKYLNDQYRFYGLAKYNNISVPSRLRGGRIIKIPGTAPPGLRVGKKTTRPTDVYYRKAKNYFDQGRYQDVIDLLESQKAKKTRGERSTDILVLAYTEQAKIYTKRADLINARIILERAIKIQPKNSKLKSSLTKIAKKLEAEQYWDKGRSYVDAGNLTQAYISFKEVLKRQPKHEAAAREIKKIKPVVIDAAYRECMLAYKKHEFDQAITLCDKVLAIEPDHELAKLHRARAHDILVKLTNIKDKESGN